MSQCNYDILFQSLHFAMRKYGCRHSHQTANFDPNIFGGGFISYGGQPHQEGESDYSYLVFSKGVQIALLAYDVPEKYKGQKVSDASTRANRFRQ
jgi:hypothetical protein